MDNIDKFIGYIRECNNIVFFGGAGVSTESGIPDFRSKDGLYNQKDITFDKYTPEYLLSHECLYNNPKVFYEFYKQKLDTRDIKPNITHNVLAKLESLGKLKAIVTQNIDGLHQKAGSKTVYEIHGSTSVNYCVKCQKEYDSDYIFNSTDKIPVCTDCKGQVRPDIVMYGEPLPNKAVNESIASIESCDMLIIGGTSLQVYPAANYISYFRGKHLIVINKEVIKIPCFYETTDIFIQSSLGDVFRRVDEIW